MSGAAGPLHAPERPLAAMILAAGRGERMRPLTDSVPKPLLEVGGEPLIERHLRALKRAGIVRITINLAWLGPLIRARLGDGARFGLSIRYSEEKPQALETAGGIFRALPGLLPGPFAVVNGDIYSDYHFEQHPGGDFGLENGLAVAHAHRPHTFSGIAVYRSSFFDGCVDGVFPLRPLLLRSMQARRCSAELYAGKWEDVGTPERLRALNTATGVQFPA